MSELSKVSLVTLINGKGRQQYLKLGVVNFMSFDYPPDKLEWVIIDDTAEGPVTENILPEDDRIKYYYFSPDQVKQVYGQYRAKLLRNNKKQKQKFLDRNEHYRAGMFVDNRLPLGLKRNLSVGYSTGSVIMHMSEDCHYPPASVRLRAEYFRDHPKAVCVGCSVLDQFHTIKMISIKNKSSDKMRITARIHSCTLAYKRQFWEKQRFDSGATENELAGFLKNRTTMCEDMPSEEVVVSLIHPLNYKQYGNAYDTMQPNGWHFDKLADELFLLITSLGEQ